MLSHFIGEEYAQKFVLGPRIQFPGSKKEVLYGGFVSGQRAGTR